MMLDYLTVDHCRMQFLTDQLDDQLGTACGECDVCDPGLAAEIAAARVPDELVAEAERFLRYRPIIVEPKKQGVPKGERSEAGRLLGRWGDGGWGEIVERAKYQTGQFGDDLVTALAEMIKAWAPEPAPEWVAAVPSTRTDPLVGDLARGVAERLGLPYLDVVMRVVDRPPQREMQNFAYQRSNVRDAFMPTGPVPASPGFLVDDESASGWTFTEVGAILRRSGATAVFPVGLSSTTGRRA